MWGAVVGILGASVALAVVSSAFETFGQTQKQEKPKGLPEPGKDFETKPDGKWQAPLFRSSTAREALKRARQAVRK